MHAHPRNQPSPRHWALLALASGYWVLIGPASVWFAAFVVFGYGVLGLLPAVLLLSLTTLLWLFASMTAIWQGRTRRAIALMLTHVVAVASLVAWWLYAFAHFG